MEYHLEKEGNARTSIRLKELPNDELPREKLKKFGPQHLTDSELLAIVLRTGSSKMNVLELSRLLVTESLGLPLLFRKKWKELARISGIGPVKAITLEAVFELSRRAATMPIHERPQFKNPHAIAKYFIPFLRDQDHESFYVASFDNQLRLLAYKQISYGLKNSVMVDITTVIKELVLNNASQAVIMHNHPSGALYASEPDKFITKRLKKACDLVGILLVDHLIIVGNDYVSLNEKGDF
jgi:DNA repair protein RadC